MPSSSHIISIHTTTHFLHGACPSCCPTMAKHWKCLLSTVVADTKVAPYGNVYMGWYGGVTVDRHQTCSVHDMGSTQGLMFNSRFDLPITVWALPTYNPGPTKEDNHGHSLGRLGIFYTQPVVHRQVGMKVLQCMSFPCAPDKFLTKTLI